MFLVGQGAVNRGVPPNLLGCPFLFGPSEELRQINRYLEDRFLGRWRPAHTTRRARRFRPAAATVRQAAHRISNFLRWLEQEGRSWAASDEGDLESYAEAMESGEWTSDRSQLPLSSSTIASRQTDVIQAMLWEVDRGTRSFEPGFSEVDVVVETPGARRTKVKRTVYDVVRRCDPAMITFPSVEEVNEHIRSVGDPALRIGVKLVYRAGLRGSEPGRLLNSDMPGAKRAGTVGMLSVVGKGNKRRKTELDVDLEAEINDFLSFAWPVRMGRLPRPSDPLLVNEAGRPISYRGLWEQFRSCRQSPHVGRHFYAIQYLLRGWEAQQLLARQSGLVLANDQMPSLLSMDLINLSRNLGHADLKTTQRYLTALAQYTRNTQIAIAYQDAIGG